MKNKFSERLRETMLAQNLTQAKLSRKLGVPFTTFSGWYHGECEPSYEMLILICNELGESADWLLGLTD